MYKLDFEVRSYECDAQGIVNNANYMHYLEHTRHEYLKSMGVNFHELHNQGYDLVVIHADLSYLKPLVADDKFYVTASWSKISRLRFCFEQEIWRGEEKILAAKITGTCISADSHRPVVCEAIDIRLEA